MTSIIVRGLDESVKQQHARQAKEPGRYGGSGPQHPHQGRAQAPYLLGARSGGAGCRGVDGILDPERRDVARAVRFE